MFKTNIKRFFVTLLCLIFIFPCFSVTAFAEKNNDEEQVRSLAPSGAVDVDVYYVGTSGQNKVYRIELTFYADIAFTDFNISNLYIRSGSSSSSTQYANFSSISGNASAPIYSVTIGGVSQFTFSVPSGTTVVYISTNNARLKYVSPYGWRSITPLTATPISLP